jgi:hypothetical protein
MRYQDGADIDEEEESKTETHGFVFFYPSIGVCKVIEVDVDSTERVSDLKEFEDWLTMVLYILNEQVHIRESKSQELMAKQKKIYSRYCIAASLDVLMRQTDILDVFNLSDSELKGRKRQASHQQAMELKVKEQRAKTLADKLS